MAKNNQKIVIITGMHRSGTSFVASILQQGGLDIGGDLLGAGHGNPRGHYEEKDFLQFHEAKLDSLGLNYLLTKRPENLKFNKEDKKKAVQLTKARSHLSLWGWKEPRSSFFLDDWKEVLGDKAKFVFIYRHPIEVAISLIHRGHHEIILNPMIAVDSWAAYNQTILDFYNKYSDICVLCHIHSITSDFKAFEKLLAAKINLGVDLQSSHSLFEKDELKSFAISNEIAQIFSQISPKSHALFLQLNQIADLYTSQKSQSNSNQHNLKELQTLSGSLSQFHMLRNNPQSELMNLLLCAVSPSIILPAKRAVESLKNNSNEQALEVKAEELNKQLIEKNAQISKLENQMSDQNKLASNFENLQIKMLEEQIAFKNDQILQLNDSINTFKSQQSRLDSNVEKLEEKLVDLESQTVQKDDSISQLTNQLTDQKNYLNQLLKEKQESQQQIESFEDQKNEQFHLQEIEFKKELDSRTNAIKAQKVELDQLKEDFNHAQKTIDQLQQIISDQKHFLKKAHQSLIVNPNGLKENTVENSEISLITQKLEEENSRLKKALETKNLQADWFDRHSIHLEEQIQQKDIYIEYLESELENLNNSISLKVGRHFYPIKKAFGINGKSPQSTESRNHPNGK